MDSHTKNMLPVRQWNQDSTQEKILVIIVLRARRLVTSRSPIARYFRAHARRSAPRRASQTALGRVGEADEVGRVIASLPGPELAWVNAESIEVGGGYQV